MQKALVLIPARYQSSRFPGKPLVPLLGQSLISRVYQNMQLKTSSDGEEDEVALDVWVVTDDDRIEKHLQGLGAQVCRVDDNVVSGSERIALSFKRYFKKSDYKLVINVQGDEPLLTSQEVIRLAQFHLKNKFDIATIYRTVSGDLDNPNRVKAVVGDNGRCLYFSRAQVPSGEGNWKQHIGIYSYLPDALEKFASLPPSKLELREMLEQLRALEAGMTIGAIETTLELIGVDTPHDINVVEGVLRGKSK